MMNIKALATSALIPFLLSVAACSGDAPESGAGSESVQAISKEPGGEANEDSLAKAQCKGKSCPAPKKQSTILYCYAKPANSRYSFEKTFIRNYVGDGQYTRCHEDAIDYNINLPNLNGFQIGGRCECDVSSY